MPCTRPLACAPTDRDEGRASSPCGAQSTTKPHSGDGDQAKATDALQVMLPPFEAGDPGFWWRLEGSCVGLPDVIALGPLPIAICIEEDAVADHLFGALLAHFNG